MKDKILALFVLMAFLIPVAHAKKEKTITYKDSTVTDAKYGVTFTIGENWKVKSFNEPSVERAFLEKKNYSVNSKVQTYGGDYTIPTVVIYAQEFNGSLDDFEALLKKSLEEHKSDNEIIQKLGLLMDSEFVISADSKIDSLPARTLILKRNYKRLLAADAYGRSPQTSGETEQFINDHEVHELFAVKKDNSLYLFQAYCEREFYGKENKGEFEAMAASMKF